MSTAPDALAPRVLPALEARGVSKVYVTGTGSLTVLSDVDLRVGAGEQVAVVGPSGSGKSTMLAILGTLDTPTTGDVLVAGRSTRNLDDGERSEVRSHHVGFVFQQFHLMAHADAVANVELGMLYTGMPPAERRDRAVAALERVGLAARLDHRPTQLSGGEQQRVAVARAIAHGPAVVLADEPTGALDQATGSAVIELLRDLDSALVVITHDVATAERFPRQVRLRDGRVIGDTAMAVSAAADPAQPGPARADGATAIENAGDS
jgi:putative ABC transport system ATP-binding protein